jgi:hypothetical protein
MCFKRGMPVAGLGSQMNAEAPPFWATYFATADADATTAAAVSAGATVLAPPMDVMEAGRMAVLLDPSGAAFSLWQAGTHAGSGLVNEPGAMCWHELSAAEPAGPEAFYNAVFGWSVVEEPMGESSYHVWKLGEASIGGMMLMDGEMATAVPPSWSVYFSVEDCDATVALTQALGGSVLVPATDIVPGRFAMLADPQGAVFGIIKETPAPGQGSGSEEVAAGGGDD